MLEELLKEISEAGFLVNNFNQIVKSSGEVVWRASLAIEATFEFGEGATPAEALLNAKRAVFKRHTGKYEHTAPPKLSKKLSLEDLGL